MSNLGGTDSLAVVDLSVHDPSAADAASDGHIKYATASPSTAMQSFGKRGSAGVVLNDDRSSPLLLCPFL
jgi:hypothetical protein